jgi:transposase
VKSIREILRLSFSCQLSGRQISKALGLSRAAIWECLRRASAADLTWPLPDTLDETKLFELLYQQPTVQTPRTQPDCLHIFNELKRKGVTLSLLWEEYKRDNHDGYQYTKFCGIYSDWLEKTNLVMRQEHRAGHKAFSDFSGGTLNIVDPHTGVVQTAKLFVCALGATSYTYAELFFSESAEAWCTGQANALSYFGGTSEILIPDNPRAVISKACPYEPDINPDFLLLAEHFGVAVVPARVRRPKDKAVVEAAVGLATRWILARLRNMTFFSLAEANLAVKRLLEDLNNRPFKKIPGSRKSLFEAIEKAALKPLPLHRYEYAHVKYARANIDYHIEIDRCYYSVPFQLVRQRLEARVTAHTIEVFSKGRRVASHAKCQRPGQSSTLDQHMPQGHRHYKDWSPARITSWASRIGPGTTTFVEQLMLRKKHPELAYRASLGVIRLARLHGESRLEAACQRAIAIGAFSYKNVKLILQNNMDNLPLTEIPQQITILRHDNIRGANYFAQQNKENTNANQPNIGESEKPETLWHGQGSGDSIEDTGHQQPAV